MEIEVQKKRRTSGEIKRFYREPEKSKLKLKVKKK